MSKRVRAYCRVSTDLQYDGGVSLEIQETRITGLCAAEEYTLVKVYKDVASGKNMQRPQMQLLLQEIQPKETIIILDLSRLSRSLKDTVNLVDALSENNIGLISMAEHIDTTSPQGRFIMNIFSALNQMERENTAKKVKETMQVLSQQGKLRSRPPFGWKFVGKDRDFEPVPEQQRVLAKIKQLHEDKMSNNKIAIVLNQDGDNQCLSENKKNPEKFEGCLFHPSTIKRILVEHGIVDGGTLKRRPIEQQIVSHHKPIERPALQRESEIVEIPTPGQLNTTISPPSEPTTQVTDSVNATIAELTKLLGPEATAPLIAKMRAVLPVESGKSVAPEPVKPTIEPPKSSLSELAKPTVQLGKQAGGVKPLVAEPVSLPKSSKLTDLLKR